MSQQLIDTIQTKYGFTAHEGDLRLCVRDIEGGQARRTAQLSSRISEYVLSIRGTLVRVSFDSKTEVITGILDPITL